MYHLQTKDKGFIQYSLISQFRLNDKSDAHPGEASGNYVGKFKDKM